MKTTIQALFTALVVAAVLFTGASTVTSCNTKKDDPAPTTTTTSTISISSWSAKLVGAQVASAGSFFSSLDGNVYLRSQATASGIVGTIDISYAALGTTTTPTLLSWAFRANTSTGLTQAVPSGATSTFFQLTTLDGAAFNNAVGTTLSNISVSSTSESVAIATGNVVAFRNAANKVGLIKVGTINPGTSGDVTIDVKVLK